MKKHLLIICCSLIINSNVSNAQILEWNKQDEWGGNNYPGGISRDSAGNLFVAGYYVEQYYASQERGVFISKYDSFGNRLWSDSSNASLRAKCLAISTDVTGNSYITGQFQGSVKFGDFLLSSNIGPDLFIAKYNTVGTCLWAINIGQASGEEIVAGNDGTFYVTGWFKSQELILGRDVLSNYTESENFFVAKYDSAGNALWGRQGQGAYQGKEIGIDANNNIYISGKCGNTLKLNADAVGSRTNGFIAKYNSSGLLQWVKDHKVVEKMCVDVEGNLFLTSGYLIGKMNPEGEYLWSKSPENNAGGWAIASDENGNVYAAGFNYPALMVGKYDTRGALEWIYEASPNSFSKDKNGYSFEPFELLTDNNGSVFLTGQLAIFSVITAKISENNVITNVSNSPSELPKNVKRHEY